MYRIWILGSILVLSNNQSKATLWVLDTSLIVGLLPMIIIFKSRLHCPQTRTTSQWTEKIWCSKAHYRYEIVQNYRAWLELWFNFSFVCSTWRDAKKGFPVLMNPWFYWIGFGKNGTLPWPNSKDPKLGYCPSVGCSLPIQLIWHERVTSENT